MTTTIQLPESIHTEIEPGKLMKEDEIKKEISIGEIIIDDTTTILPLDESTSLN